MRSTRQLLLFECRVPARHITYAEPPTPHTAVCMPNPHRRDQILGQLFKTAMPQDEVTLAESRFLVFLRRSSCPQNHAKMIAKTNITFYLHRYNSLLRYPAGGWF